jgi:hypothetical protein
MRFDAARSILRSTCALGIILLAACAATGGDGGLKPITGVAGLWSTPAGVQTSLNVQLMQADVVLTGTGTLGVPPLAPTTGPATPAYTGDNFTITSGSFVDPNVSFTATLGANPDGAGGFYHGTLSFNGTQSGSTMTGTLTFTPPRTASQVFAAQTVSAVALKRS